MEATLDTACWPQPGQEIFSKSLVSTDSPSTFFSQCHCMQWRQGGFDTADLATAALVAHRGEFPPPRTGGTDA